MSRLPTYSPALIKRCKKSIVLIVVLVCTIAMGTAQDNEKAHLEKQIARLKAAHGFKVNDTNYINLLNDLAKKQRYYKADSLLLLSRQALKYSTRSRYLKGESTALLRLGDFYSDQGNNAKAIQYYWKSSEIAKKIHSYSLLIRSLNNLAGEYTYKGDYAKALNGYLEAIELAEKVNQKNMLSILNENIANLYASQKDYEQSLDFYTKVKKINNELGNEIYMAETTSNLASVYADMGQLEYAMFNINKSIRTFEQKGIRDWLAFAYEIKGKVYLKEGKYKWALFWYNQSKLLHDNLNDDRGKIDLLNGMAEAYLAQGKDKLSEKHAMEAFEISNHIQFMEGILKCSKTLYMLHKNKEDYVGALTYHEIYQKLSDTLTRNENKKSLTLFKTKTHYDEQKANLILANEKALAKQQSYIYASLVFLLIFIGITLIVYRGQKVQKKLNAELQANQEILEKREQELNESNDTKTKLFSIIGHDLRGPIAALNGLLNMFKDGEIGKTEFLAFMPKLRDDVEHISFTLNNLLSWGYTQMNGSYTKPATIPIDALVTENIQLLSEIADNKSIKIVSKVSENTLSWADSNQIDIVVRNLLSNALKFTPENGMVTIEAYEKTKYWQVLVRDTGIGMEKSVVDKLFVKNSSYTTYGTNNEKGTGLGLALCKEMVEKNNGQIWVDSIPRKGTTFYFTLPKSEKKYSQAS